MALSGLGIGAPSGQPGPAGPQGPSGGKGLSGKTRRLGRPWPLGAVRVVCAARSAPRLDSDGARGPAHRRGMVCRVALTVSRRAIRVEGRLVRDRTVHARGALAVRDRRLRLSMPAIHRSTAGRYTLKLAVTDRGGARTVMRTQVVLAR